MILKKLWRWAAALVNKWTNRLRGLDPIAEMQYECDRAVEQVKEGRRGLEMYRGLIERVKRQVLDGDTHRTGLVSKVQSYLASGDRETAAKFALELQTAEQQVAENQAQLKLHEEAYQNNVAKVQHATRKIQEVRERVSRYDADMRLSRAEAEIARLSSSLNFDVTTDFGQIEQAVQEKIDVNRAAVRVAADLSGNGLDDIRRDQDIEKRQAEEALKKFESRAGTPCQEGQS